MMGEERGREGEGKGRKREEREGRRIVSCATHLRASLIPKIFLGVISPDPAKRENCAVVNFP